jgi:hypothetical protein
MLSICLHRQANSSSSSSGGSPAAAMPLLPNASALEAQLGMSPQDMMQRLMQRPELLQKFQDPKVGLQGSGACCGIHCNTIASYGISDVNVCSLLCVQQLAVGSEPSCGSFLNPQPLCKCWAACL